MATDSNSIPRDDIDGIGLDPGDVLRLYYRRKRLIAGIFAGILVVAAVLSYLVPPSYVSTAELLIARNEPDVSEGDYQRPVTALDRGELLATEAEILTSEGLVLRALSDNAKLSAAPTETDYVKIFMKYAFMPLKKLGLIYEGDDPLADRVRSLSKRIEVTEHVDANTLLIEFEHDSPEVAQRTLQALIESYLRFRIDTLRRPQLQAHFEERMAETDDRMAEIGGQLLDLELESGMIRPDVELDHAVAHLAEMRNDLVDLRVEQEALRGRLEQINALKLGKEKSIVIRRESGRNPAWSTLSESVTSIEKRLELMGAVYRDDSEPVTDLKTELALIRALMEKTPEMIPTVQVVGANEQLASLLSEEDRALIELATIERRLEALADAIEGSREDLRGMNRWATEVARTDAEMMAVTNTYRIYLGKREAAKLAETADKGEINVKVIKPALRPDKPTTHRLIPIVAAGIAGLALAFALVTFLELLNGTVRNERDVARALGVPVLASIEAVSEEAQTA